MSAEKLAKISLVEINQIEFLKRIRTPNYKIAENLNISLSTVEKYVTKLRMQLQQPPIEGMSCDKARILGYLHGDGCKHIKFDKWYYDYVRHGGCYVPVKKNYKKPRARICVEFYNTNVKVMERMRIALEKVYGCRVKYFPKKYQLFVKSARAVKDLLSYSDIGCYVWRVPREVVEGPADVQKAYIQAFADAEGTIDTHEHHHRITIDSNNVFGLRQIRTMLDKIFDIPCKLYGPYSKGKYRLTISRKECVLSYRTKIGFTHPVKAEKLERLN